MTYLAAFLSEHFKGIAATRRCISTLLNINDGTFNKNSLRLEAANRAQKMKFFIKDFFSKCDEIRSFLWIWSHLLKNSLMENFIFCVV